MATLAIAKPRTFEVDESYGDMPVKAATKIYEGSAVSDSGGNGLAAPLTAAEAFAGFAVETADNTSGAAGAITVKVKRTGTVRLSVTGVTAVTDYGVTVYASDDNTFTLTSTDNTAIGKVVKYISGTEVMVKFEAAADRSL